MPLYKNIDQTFFLHKCAIPIILAVYVFFFYSPAMANTSSMLDQTVNDTLIDHFSPESLSSDISKKFNAYLIDNTGYSHHDYDAGLRQMITRYLKTIVEFSKCQKSTDKAVDQSPSRVVDELIKTFGKETIAKHEKAICYYIFSLELHQKNTQCRDKQAHCVLIESYLMSSLKDYIELFLEFNKSLNNPSITTTLKTEAENFLMGFHYPIQEITTTGNISMTLSTYGFQKTGEIPEQMVEFFNTNPYFLKPFDAMKTIEKLNDIKK